MISYNYNREHSEIALVILPASISQTRFLSSTLLPVLLHGPLIKTE